MALGLTEEKGLGNNADKSVGNGNGNAKDDPCGQNGQREIALAGDKGQGQDNGKGKDHQQLKLGENTTSYLYTGIGLNVLKEYQGMSAPRAEYYYANGQVLGRKLFGLKGDLWPGRYLVLSAPRQPLSAAPCGQGHHRRSQAGQQVLRVDRRYEPQKRPANGRKAAHLGRSRN